MELPNISLNKSTDIWRKLFQIETIDEFKFDGNEGICDITMPTSSGGDKYVFCEQKVSNYPNTTLYYSDKFTILARVITECGKNVLMYYVELNPNAGVSINEASNEGTAMENYILDKHKLSAFSLYNAANLDIPLASQQIHLDQMERQSSNKLLIFQTVNVNNHERLLFKPMESEFDQAVTPIVMLLETTYKGKYKVTTHMDEATDILCEKINAFCSK